MIESICQNCGNKKMFSDDKSGKKYKCPNCNEVVLIESIGTLITTELQANVTNSYAVSIEKAEQEKVAGERQLEYEKLLKKSKTWNGWGIAFFGLAGLAFVEVFSEDKSQILSVILFGGFGLYFINRSKEFKESAVNYFNENLADSSASTTDPTDPTDPTESDDLHGENQEVNDYSEKINNVPQESTTTNWALIVLAVLGVLGMLCLIIWKVNSSIPTTNTNNNSDSTKTENVTTLNTTPIDSTKFDTVKLITDSTIQNYGNANNNQGKDGDTISYIVSSDLAYFYEEPNGKKIKDIFLEKNDVIISSHKKKGFVYTEFNAGEDIFFKGWINVKDLSNAPTSP